MSEEGQKMRRMEISYPDAFRQLANILDKPTGNGSTAYEAMSIEGKKVIFNAVMSIKTVMWSELGEMWPVGKEVIE